MREWRATWPALIRRYDEAVRISAAEVVNWGTGTTRREFLHVDELADACLFLFEHFDGPKQLNIGTGSNVTIKQIADTIARLVGFDGDTVWDTTKPGGTPQKFLDVSKLATAGWPSRVSLEEGLRSTIELYRNNREVLQNVADRAPSKLT